MNDSFMIEPSNNILLLFVLIKNQMKIITMIIFKTLLNNIKIIYIIMYKKCHLEEVELENTGM